MALHRYTDVAQRAHSCRSYNGPILLYVVKPTVHKRYAREASLMSWNHLPEMVMAIDRPATAEAEQLTTVATRHLVAPFCFDDRHSAFWT